MPYCDENGSTAAPRIGRLWGRRADLLADPSRFVASGRHGDVVDGTIVSTGVRQHVWPVGLVENAWQLAGDLRQIAVHTGVEVEQVA